MNSNGNLPSAVIFDMDGVLVDTSPFHLQKWSAFLTEHGIPFDRINLPKLVLGPPNDPIIRFFFGDRITPEETRRLSEELELRFRTDFAPHAKPLPGVVRLLEECRDQGVRNALASAAIGKNVQCIVDALGLRENLQVILSGDEVTHAKPDPEVYLKTAHHLGLAAAHCVAIEDSFVGIEAAKAAGMKCVAVASTFPAPDLIAGTQADLVVQTLQAVHLQTLRELFVAAPTCRKNTFDKSSGNF